jgi:hypothetical protein
MLQLASSHVLAIVLFVAVLLFVPHVITIIILTTQTDVPNAQQVVDLAFNAILHNHQIVYLLGAWLDFTLVQVIVWLALYIVQLAHQPPSVQVYLPNTPWDMCL